MHKFLVFGFSMFCCGFVSAQITVQLSSLPEIGDQLLYQSIAPDSLNAKIDNQVFQIGGNLNWDFSNLPSGIGFEETYAATSSGTVSDSFPDADLLVDFFGLTGFAKRNTTNISILGVVGDSIAGLNVPIIGALNSPFVVRRAPIGFNDQFTASSSFSVTLDASTLDTIQQFQDFISNIPGTTADSLRITVGISRDEDIVGWGELSLPSGSRPVLKSTQEDVVSTTLEIYAITFIGSAWVDLTPFLPDDFQEFLSVSTTSHVFYGEENKEVLAKFSMAPDSTHLTTRYARDITSNLFSPSFQNKINALIFPNPTLDNINFTIPDNIDLSTLQVELLSISGRRVYFNNYPRNHQLDISKIPSGLYLLNIYNPSGLLYSQSISKSSSN